MKTRYLLLLTTLLSFTAQADTITIVENELIEVSPANNYNLSIDAEPTQLAFTGKDKISDCVIIGKAVFPKRGRILFSQPELVCAKPGVPPKAMPVEGILISNDNAEGLKVPVCQEYGKDEDERRFCRIAELQPSQMARFKFLKSYTLEQ